LAIHRTPITLSACAQRSLPAGSVRVRSAVGGRLAQMQRSDDRKAAYRLPAPSGLASARIAVGFPAGTSYSHALRLHVRARIADVNRQGKRSVEDAPPWIILDHNVPRCIFTISFDSRGQDRPPETPHPCRAKIVRRSVAIFRSNAWSLVRYAYFRRAWWSHHLGCAGEVQQHSRQVSNRIRYGVCIPFHATGLRPAEAIIRSRAKAHGHGRDNDVALSLRSTVPTRPIDRMRRATRSNCSTSRFIGHIALVDQLVLRRSRPVRQ